MVDAASSSSSDADSDSDDCGSSAVEFGTATKIKSLAKTTTLTKTNQMKKHRTFILLSLIGITIAASIAVGYAAGMILIRDDDDNNNPTASLLSNDNNLNTDRGSINSIRGNTNEQQLLLEMAERITIACSEEALERYGVYRSECRMLCHDNLCCFEEETRSSGGELSCANDESKACAVYAGCRALVQ